MDSLTLTNSNFATGHCHIFNHDLGHFLRGYSCQIWLSKQCPPFLTVEVLSRDSREWHRLYGNEGK